jgi:hypothetical protein
VFLVLFNTVHYGSLVVSLFRDAFHAETNHLASGFAGVLLDGALEGSGRRRDEAAGELPGGSSGRCRWTLAWLAWRGRELSSLPWMAKLNKGSMLRALMT